VGDFGTDAARWSGWTLAATVTAGTRAARTSGATVYLRWGGVGSVISSLSRPRRPPRGTTLPSNLRPMILPPSLVAGTKRAVRSPARRLCGVGAGSIWLVRTLGDLRGGACAEGASAHAASNCALASSSVATFP
jgi:hypothetical protein